ncbi:hypothetical protein V5F38_05245 [Xanthobacter sp. V0B-10]|uniref:hypothetical protein n=1 Tax=Xanthobacter albus TaxID=3119929 RepID=UPI00372BF8B7
MSVPLTEIFAEALAAKPVPRRPPNGGTKLWREWLHDYGQLAFARVHSDASRRWYRRSRELTYGVALSDPRRAVWRAEFRAHLARVLRWYRHATPVSRRPSRCHAFAMEAERIRIFGEDA